MADLGRRGQHRRDLQRMNEQRERLRQSTQDNSTTRSWEVPTGVDPSSRLTTGMANQIDQNVFNEFMTTYNPTRRTESGGIWGDAYRHWRDGGNRNEWANRQLHEYQQSMLQAMERQQEESRRASDMRMRDLEIIAEERERRRVVEEERQKTDLLNLMSERLGLTAKEAVEMIKVSGGTYPLPTTLQESTEASRPLPEPVTLRKIVRVAAQVVNDEIESYYLISENTSVQDCLKLLHKKIYGAECVLVIREVSRTMGIGGKVNYLEKSGKRLVAEEASRLPEEERSICIECDRTLAGDSEEGIHQSKVVGEIIELTVSLYNNPEYKHSCRGVILDLEVDAGILIDVGEYVKSLDEAVMGKVSFINDVSGQIIIKGTQPNISKSLGPFISHVRADSGPLAYYNLGAAREVQNTPVQTYVSIDPVTGAERRHLLSSEWGSTDSTGPVFREGIGYGLANMNAIRTLDAF